MLNKIAVGVIAAASFVVLVPAAQAQVPTELITNGPQADPGDSSPRSSAPQNVRESEQYDRLVRTSSAFRRAREQKECGPIDDPQLQQSCLASFGNEGALSGSSEAPPMRPGYGNSAPAPREPGYAAQPQPGYVSPPQPYGTQPGMPPQPR